jgi:hypothetical protein
MAQQSVPQQAGRLMLPCNNLYSTTRQALMRLFTCIIRVHGYRMLEGFDLEGLQQRAAEGIRLHQGSSFSPHS